MKHHFYKILLVVPLLLFAQNLSAATYYFKNSTDGNFNTPANWGAGTISSAHTYYIANGATVTLTADATVGTIIIDNGTLDFNGFTLSTLNFQIFKNGSIINSASGSQLKYTSSRASNLFIWGDRSLSDFLFPMNAIRPEELTIREGTLTLTQDITVSTLRMAPGPAYLDLNGHDLNLKYFRRNDLNHAIICDPNSSIIIEDTSVSTQTIKFSTATGENILKQLKKLGSSSHTFNIENDVQILEALVCESGSIASNGSITLLSDATQTAYVGESAGTISATGGFNVQQYIPGRRVFRFLAHPFSSAIALSQLTDDIDITGTGGTSNGFTATINDNPSAYYFDVAAANNTSSGLNPGWTDFANTTSNSWAKASPALIYIRGAKGEGIDGNAYTPSAVTLDMSGTINSKQQLITLTKGSNSTFVTVGNPYPSPIQMQSITSAKRSNVSSTYWVFDANLGANGGYVSKLWDTDSYVLPAYAGFATEVSATGSITFEESHKTTATPADIFLGGSHLSDLVLNVFVNDRLYDLTRLITHDQAQSDKDYFDGGKMENADINFFTISKNGEQLSIDARPFDLNTERIAMGLFSSSNRTIKIQADPSTFLNEHSVTLIDHYTNKQYNLNEGASVELSIDLNQSKSYGTERLELVIGQLQSHTEKLNQAHVTVYPNPSQSSNSINVQANSPIQHIAVMDISGRLVWEISPENKSEFMEIQETALANAGIYFIEITTALGTSSQKHVVQN